jgi:hypothetical protein
MTKLVLFDVVKMQFSEGRNRFMLMEDPGRPG